MDQDPIIIIGTGLAGYSVAREFRKHDKQTPVVLITRDDGASYYKPDISEAKAKGRDPAELVQKTAEEMAEMLDVVVRTHEQVETIQPEAHQIQLAGETLTYDKLVLAWGAEPVVLNLCGDATDDIHKVNHLADYRIFRDNLPADAHVAVLGAGLIGCEFANDLTEAGHPVTVADPAAWPLSQLIPQAAGEAVQNALSHAGVTWHLGHAATGVHHGEDGKYRITLDDETVVEADIVLSAVGLKASVQLAEDAGLSVDRGIVVDRTLRTSDADIYALGDCAEVDGHWRPYVAPLMQCARTLGKTLAADEDDTPGQVTYPTLPIIIKTHACPVIAYPPVDGHGEWQVEGDGSALEATCRDKNGNMVGFVLTGEATNKRRDYIKDAPALMG
ncbi:NAD(P)/FAD-dependent oxidoreductase [Salinisphaera sp. Q1T1-3]|uniref:NAD(P)/FAD-dependent oxidoreductase n=1 Tax=Salinisphaera sp. Q1T1-3 TaxID=2321229 RepID=UPI000E740C14|nr:FAD-dependent oxidoreductase [Salinisphaera sp. Q1T1-3]RJS93549.1 FAD-dependent oxidoreductase [Salinisphaera sp. Q1T1-3]